MNQTPIGKTAAMPALPALRSLPLVLLVAVLVQGAASQASGRSLTGLPSLASLVPADAYAELVSAGKIVRTAAPGGGLSLLPAHEGAARIGASMASEKPNLIVETLYIYRRPSPADPEAELRTIYGTMLSISSLEGIEYWSASRKKMRTFYAESYRIDDPKTRKRIPDASAPATGPLPSMATYYSFQRDLTFGANVYRYTYVTAPGSVFAETVNLTSLTYLALPIMAPEGLKVRLLVIQANDALLFYVASGANAPSIGIIRDKVQESVMNRATALYKWFESKQAR